MFRSTFTSSNNICKRVSCLRPKRHEKKRYKKRKRLQYKLRPVMRVDFKKKNFNSSKKEWSEHVFTSRKFGLKQGITANSNVYVGAYDSFKTRQNKTFCYSFYDFEEGV